MHRGYIKLWRKIHDNPFWKEKRVFSRAEAWIDMIMLANHKEGHIRKRGIKIEVGRGEIAWSEIELSSRWNWSRGKVRRFLSELSSKTVQQIEPVIEQQNKNVTSRYKIINYHLYQGDDTTNGTTDETASDTANGQQTDSKRYRNKNDKNVKNDKNINITPNGFDDFWKIYPNRKSKGQALKAWLKLKKEKRLPSIEILTAAIKSQISEKEYLRDTNQFCPEWKHPATWLNASAWEDEQCKSERKNPYEW